MAIWLREGRSLRPTQAGEYLLAVAGRLLPLNAHKIAERLRDHKLMTAFAPYDKPQVAVAMILENGGAGPAVGTIMRQILDHIMLGDNNTNLPAENPAVAAAEDQ